MWDCSDMSLFLKGFQYWSVFQSFGSIPLYWLPVGLTVASQTILNLVAVLTEQISYLLLRGITKNQLQFLGLYSLFIGSDINALSFRFKFPYPLQWGPPTFSAGHSFAMMSGVLVSMVEVHLIDDTFYLNFKLTRLEWLFWVDEVAS